MIRFRTKCAAVVAVAVFLLLACVVSGGDPPSSSSAEKHYGKIAALHVRKLLNITAAPKNAVAAAMAEEKRRRRITAPAECSQEAVSVYQENQGYLPSGIPSFSVTITNTCLGCTVRDVHVACGEFASAEVVVPSDFRRVSVGDCLVKDGGALAPGEMVAFEYSNSFQYELNVASVSCG